MRFRRDRLRAPEWALGVVSLALLVVVFVLDWYYRSSGWQSLDVLGPLAAVVAALGVVLLGLQATSRAPAVPVTLTVVELAIGLVLVLGLIIRFAIDSPLAGGWVGLALAALLCACAYWSLRVDGIAEADAPRSIEML
jgi:uncharacterized membrane protein YphA (DoxX/SURF4 family)